MKIVEKKRCLSCGESKPLSHFYISHSPLHYDKKVPWCKNCIKKNVLNEDGSFNTDKLKEVMRQIDKPYYLDNIQSARNQLIKEDSQIDYDTVDQYGEKIFQFYMKNLQTLRQLKSKNFTDSEKDGFVQKNSAILDNKNPSANVENNTVINGKKIYSTKWRGEYTQNDINDLDKYLLDLQRDFNIVRTNHIDYAKKIAKASLQMDKAFNDMMNNIPGADAKYKVAKETFDTLSKSAKFSESTRDTSDIGASNFSKIASLVENHNWIPEHKPLEKDTIDEMIDYLSTITKSL